jgi:hypothetical protein
VQVVTPTTELPDDPALPGLAAIRQAGLAAVIPALGLDDGPVQLQLRGYTPGLRATLEARAGHRRFAVKVYWKDPEPEVALYQALAAAGLASGAEEVRVPPLLAWDRHLRTLVIGWLEGPTANQLVKTGQGRRAGELAALWLRRAATLPVRLGPPLGAAALLERAPHWVAALDAADPALGVAATAAAGLLELARPKEGALRLVHGTLYARHVLDTGDGPGLIDWDGFGQGPAELDAATFLATSWRTGLRDAVLAGEAAQAEESFLAGTEGVVDERALAWHRAATLLRLAGKVHVVDRRKANWLAWTHVMLAEATRLAKRARPEPVVRVQVPALSLNRAALELVLQALSTRPATPEELDQLRKLLDEARHRAS